MSPAIESIIAEHILVAALLVIGVLAVLRSQPRMKRTRFTTTIRIGTYWTNAGALILGAAVPVALWPLAGRSLATLGLTWGRLNQPAITLTLLFAVWYVLETLWRFTGSRLASTVRRFQRDAPFMPSTPRELAHFCVLAVAAGVCEEIIFRGFPISYVASWTGNSIPGLTLAIVLPAAGFGLVHRYQGWRLVAWITTMSAIFGAIFVLTGSLAVLIVLHIAVDITAGLLTVRFVPPTPQAEFSGASTDPGVTEPANHESVNSSL